MWSMRDLSVGRLLQPQFGGKARAVGQRADLEDIRQRGAEVGKGGSHAESDVGANRWSGSQQRHALARVVGPLEGGVGAVVAGNEERVAWTQRIQHARQPGVYVAQTLGVAFGIAPVAV